jgi:tRNA pseudouridine38-40 synthase
MRYRAVVEYDGTDYLGFQRQREGPTVQLELEQAIEVVSGDYATVIGAGRTDSGVHALGQVIAFDLEWRHSPGDLRNAVNANLPDSVVLRSMEKAENAFHPRHDARKRTYQYHIYNLSIRSPLRRRVSWQVKQPISMDVMNEAAQSLIGTHDFSTFGQPPQGDNAVREIFRATWWRDEDLLIFEIVANAFLKRMVRSLVGTMKAVGEGSWTVQQFEQATNAKDRSKAGKTAPACGLFLMSVSYELDNVGV